MSRPRSAVPAALAALWFLTACTGETGPAGASPSSTSPSRSDAASAETSTVAGSTATPGASASTTGTGGSGSPSSGASGTSRCRSDRLRVSLGAAEGAAGSVVRTLVFTNRGQATCLLRGFPGVSYVTGNAGRQVGAAAERSGPPGSLVRLPPGSSAFAALRLVNVRTFDAAACRPTAVRGLRIYPPGERAALFLPAPGTGCAGTPPGPQLLVRAVQASAS